MKKIRAVNEGSDFCFLSKRKTLLQGLHIRGKTKDQHIEESMEYSNRVNREMIRQLDNKCCKLSSHQEAGDQLQHGEHFRAYMCKRTAEHTERLPVLRMKYMSAEPIV